jgi:hypothetical protein
MSKLITAGEGAGLIVGNRESRKIMIEIEIEGSCPLVMGEKRVERFRDASGRWVKAATTIRRLEALGCRVIRFDIGETGPHTPSYVVG